MRQVACLVASAILLLSGSLARAEEHAALSGGVTRVREMMHTRVTIAIVDDRPAAELEAAFSEAFAVFTRIEEVMNEWAPGTPLALVNAGAGGAGVAAPADLCAAVRASLDGARRTKGLFDPTWAALRGLWRFGDDSTFTVPEDKDVAAKCALVGWENVEVKPARDGCLIRLRRSGMALGLGGLAKGWGVDQAVAVLRAKGFRNFFVQAGGDLYAAGRHGTRPWRVGIRDPRGPADQYFAVADIEDAAFSTSGDYEHFAIKDGVRYHHIIDLRTCRPAMNSRSSTILAKSAIDAEFLTKATFILGGQDGLELAESFGAGAVIVDAHAGVHVSKSLQGKVQYWAPIP